MIREDYFTDSGNYVFKCFPDCCDKVLGNFPNLVVHHEASCLATPVDLYSKKRKVRTTPKSGKITKPSLATPVRTENPDILLLCPKSGTRVYDHNNKLTSFTCPFCERVLLKEDYSTDEGTYIFKCFPDCCDKITDNFNNLVAHHESFCPFKPQQLHSKKRRSARKSEEVNYNPTRSVKIEGTISGHSPAKRMRKSPTGSNLKSQPDNFTVSKSAHRVYDGNNKLFSFGCPFCRKLIMRDDYSVGAGKYVFKCLPECCGKIADNFSNLVAHHESFCPSKPKQLHSKRRQSHRKPGLGQGSNSSEKLVPMNQGFKYNAAHFVIGFKCPRCEKEFLPADFQTEDGSWVFKCPFESCEKVTTTFVNLAYHHGVHCSSKTAKKSTPKRSPSEKTEAVSVSPNAGVKPFACTRCPRKYKEQKALKFHMRLHYDEERTLKCSTCGESCEGRSKLNEHKRTHRAEYKSCPSCAKVFLNQQDLDNHIAKDHSNTSENDNSLESEELHVQGIS
ncbi:unnamed protein product [Allacma fusca]|nr:unnamed protein product [Allacma fusca]